jgi:hypothetical protein
VLQRRVVRKKSDVSEEHTVSIFMVEEEANQEVGGRQNYVWRLLLAVFLLFDLRS